jgi:hypothetical protein
MDPGPDQERNADDDRSHPRPELGHSQPFGCLVKDVEESQSAEEREDTGEDEVGPTLEQEVAVVPSGRDPRQTVLKGDQEPKRQDCVVDGIAEPAGCARVTMG